MGHPIHTPPLPDVLPMAQPLEVLYSVVARVSVDMVDDIAGVRTGGTIDLHHHTMNQWLVTSYPDMPIAIRAVPPYTPMGLLTEYTPISTHQQM